MIKTPNIDAGILATVALIAVAWTIPALMLPGCGKKAPPEPPPGNRPPAVRDLSYSVTNNTVHLSWTIPATDVKRIPPITGFLIYSAKQTSIEADCPNCPIRFALIGNVPVRSTGPAQRQLPVVFTQTVEPGYHYIFKLNAYNDREVVSRDSNFVEFYF